MYISCWCFGRKKNCHSSTILFLLGTSPSFWNVCVWVHIQGSRTGVKINRERNMFGCVSMKFSLPRKIFLVNLNDLWYKVIINGGNTILYLACKKYCDTWTIQHFVNGWACFNLYTYAIVILSLNVFHNTLRSLPSVMAVSNNISRISNVVYHTFYACLSFCNILVYS